ncbi:MAG: hypothetical protein V4668_01800 [Patescibacteria group bacterium]
MSKTLTSNTLFALVASIAMVSSGLYIWSQINDAKSEVVSEIPTATSARVATVEAQLAADPTNVNIALSLSELYLQTIRETGDARLYEKIDTVLTTAQSARPTDARVLAKRAELANGRHEFNEGLELINEALALDDTAATYYGIKTDAEIELGQYEAAQQSLQKMVSLKPNFSSYTRIAYVRELYGDKEGAREALEAAISAGSVYTENIAWAHVELGKLLFGTATDESKKQFEQALALYPNYAPALEGLGRVAYDAGDKNEALLYFTKAFEVLPIAQYATTLGDYYTLEKEVGKAEQYYTLADLAYRDSKGVNVDLEYAYFLARHGDGGEALTRANRAYEARPSLFAAYTYALALYKNNKLTEAEEKITEAMRIGEYDPDIVMLASTIYAANNNTKQAESYAATAKNLSTYGALLNSTVFTN